MTRMAKQIEGLAGQVSPQSVLDYAVGHGCESVPDVDSGIALFQRPGSDLDQLIVPLCTTGPDYARRIVDVLTNLTEIEHRAAEEILNDLLRSE